MILFPFFATLIYSVVPARHSTKCSLTRLRSYVPELKPTTGTSLHHSSIFLRCFCATIFVSPGVNSSHTFSRIFFPRRYSSSMNLRTNSAGSFSHICVGSRSRVSPELTEIGTCTLSNVSLDVCSFPLVLVPIRFEVIQDHMRIGSCLLQRQIFAKLCSRFTHPRLNNDVTCTPEISCAVHRCFVQIFVCFVATYDFFAVRETSWAPVPKTTVILEHRSCFMVIAIHWGPFHPTLAAVSTLCMMNVNFVQLVILCTPQMRMKSFFQRCLRSFNFFSWTINDSLPVIKKEVNEYRQCYIKYTVQRGDTHPRLWLGFGPLWGGILYVPYCQYSFTSFFTTAVDCVLMALSTNTGRQPPHPYTCIYLF